MAARVLPAAMGHDPQDPFSRPLALAAAASRRRSALACPSRRWQFFMATTRPEAAFDEATAAHGARWAARRWPIDFAPLAQAAALLYESALVAERYAAIRAVLRRARGRGRSSRCAASSRSGRDYSAADLYDAADAGCARWASRPRRCGSGIDVLLVPTAPTHYTHRRRCRPTRWR